MGSIKRPAHRGIRRYGQKDTEHRLKPSREAIARHSLHAACGNANCEIPLSSEVHVYNVRVFGVLPLNYFLVESQVRGVFHTSAFLSHASLTVVSFRDTDARAF